MGSIDKGLQKFRGRSLAAHAALRLAPQVGPLLVSANRNRSAYEILGHPVIEDASEPGEGPLAGIAAGLAACRTTHLAAVACDAPFFPADLVARLSAAFEDRRVQFVFARTAVRVHPVFCMVRTDAASALALFLEHGGRSLQGWARYIGGIAVEFESEAAFQNLNTLDELKNAEQAVEQRNA